MARQYRRDSQGRFAGTGTPGAKITTGRAGGFANANHRARVQGAKAASRLDGKTAARSVQKKSTGRHSALKRTVQKNAGAIGLVAGYGALAAAQSRSNRKISSQVAGNKNQLQTLARALNNARNEIESAAYGKPLR